MSRKRIQIRPEYSAQRRSHPRNPALKIALELLWSVRGNAKLGKVADLGCGKLRHYGMLSTVSDTLFLIDTERQITSTHTDKGKIYTVENVAKEARQKGKKVYSLSYEKFIESNCLLDVIFCIAVFDVVPRNIRRILINAAASKLLSGGHFVIIIPRNDSSILKRCSKENKYLDGHVFCHHGIYTYFHNFRNYESILKGCNRVCLRLVADLSNYRQVCLILVKK